MFLPVADYRRRRALYRCRMDWLERIRTWTSHHRTGIAVGLVVILATGDSIAATFVPVSGSEREADWFAYALIVAASAMAFWWRTKPLMALPLATLFVVSYWVLDYAGSTDPVLWVLFYAATRHGGQNRRRVYQVVTVCFAVIVGTATIGVLVPTEDLPALAIVGIFLIHGTAAAIGEALYQRSQYVAELEQRAAMLEADLDNKTALAAVEERTRIAREMHDIIAHGMSTVVVQAQAGQSVIDSNPAKAREVLSTIEHIGRDSVDEMRRMLGVLRTNTGELELGPQPTFDDLAELGRHAEDAGVAISIVVEGQPQPLPPGLELTGYRVVQEALTNVIRHAGRPVQAQAHIVYSDDSLDIAVSDDGLGAGASARSAGTGHGLLGMRERVEIYNGSFTSGPQPGGGYQVHVSLPMPQGTPS